MYDSEEDTKLHQQKVKEVGEELLDYMQYRLESHDISKLMPEEKEGYDKYIPLLKKTPYGTPEYNKVRKEMEERCLSHHYQVNRHHPEHFENGINDFTLVDLFEYFVDTYAASTKSDTPYEKGVMINAKKHDLPDSLVSIFKNTVKEYFD